MSDQIRRALAPDAGEISALPVSSNGEAARDLLSAKGGSVLDIGCGDGKFTRGLAKMFASVGGVDVKGNKIGDAKAAATDAGLTIDFRVASGEDLPFADKFFDVVAFSNSLHHMPGPAAALKEAARVLKDGGLLYVMEPVPSGNYHEATKLVNDETVVRTEAYEEVLCLASRGFTPLRETMYRSLRNFGDFEEWRADQIDRDVKRKALFDQRPGEVRERFEANAARVDGRLEFTQVFRVNLLERNRAD